MSHEGINAYLLYRAGILLRTPAIFFSRLVQIEHPSVRDYGNPSGHLYRHYYHPRSLYVKKEKQRAHRGVFDK